MANTFTSLNYHIVFSTKLRQPWLTEPIRERLWPYLAGIARENDLKMLEVGGVADHLHMLISIPAATTVAKAVQAIKGGATHWIKSNWPHLQEFSWQDGYGAFTVSESQTPTVRDYIQRQPEHHRTTSFAEEYRAFLDRHQIQYDERYLLG
jgi:REP element-mobilizing transposase RayT